MSEQLINLYFIRHGYSCSNYIKNTRKRKQGGGKRYSLMTKFKKRVSRPLKMQVRKLASQVKLYNQIQDPVLTDAGIESSIFSGQEIKDTAYNEFPKTFDLVLCSNLRRAMETALYMFPYNIVHSVPYIGEVSKYKALPNTLDNTPLSKEDFLKWYDFKYWNISQNTARNRNNEVAYKHDPFNNNENDSNTSDAHAITNVQPIILDNLLHPYKKVGEPSLISEKDITKGPNYKKFLKMLVRTFIPTINKVNETKKEINIAIVTHSSFIKKNVPRVKHALREPYGSKLNNNVIIKLIYKLEDNNVFTLITPQSPHFMYNGCELDKDKGNNMCCGDNKKPCIPIYTDTCLDDLCDHQKYVSKKKKSKLKKKFESDKNPHKKSQNQTQYYGKSNNNNC